MKIRWRRTEEGGEWLGLGLAAEFGGEERRGEKRTEEKKGKCGVGPTPER